jgi:hypothetical protein
MDAKYCDRQSSHRGGTQLNVKPAMGFTLPSAGVTRLCPTTTHEKVKIQIAGRESKKSDGDKKAA